jgi:hypothetical protein
MRGGGRPSAAPGTSSLGVKVIKPFSACSLYYKSFKIVIYDHNDSAQYYKTVIMIIIYDHSKIISIS